METKRTRRISRQDWVPSYRDWTMDRWGSWVGKKSRGKRKKEGRGEKSMLKKEKGGKDFRFRDT